MCDEAIIADSELIAEPIANATTTRFTGQRITLYTRLSQHDISVVIRTEQANSDRRPPLLVSLTLRWFIDFERFQPSIVWATVIAWVGIPGFGSERWKLTRCDHAVKG